MKYYSIVPLVEKGAEIKSPFIACLGGKGNGKTYSAISGSSENVHFGVKGFFSTGRPFVYLRYKEKMIEKSNIQTLLNGHLQDIKNLSKGKYNAIRYSSGVFYLYNETKKNVKPVAICYCRALRTLENNTGADLGEISCVIYDEVLSRTEKEPANLFTKLMIAHNNFVRNRTDYYIPFIMIGNTFTRSSVLFRQFGINLYKTQPGDVFISKNRKGEIRLLFEHCKQADVQDNAFDLYYSRFDDESIKMITHGSWAMSDYPMILQNMENKQKIFNIAFVGNSEQGLIKVQLFIDMSRVCAYVSAPDSYDKYDLWVTGKPMTRKEDVIVYTITSIPVFATLAKCIASNCLYCDLPESVEIFRDILATIHGGDNIRRYLD